ncbi:sigma-E processing peptidase SpoIIGA [Lactonifactor longoviformis]|uniref:Sporulation sigma-E factor-processing peptidase n=1 Tax=Lactonifactor longoviformis DSM 17459 TaxID=1122155 RepID=A0A1M4SKD0_9CLOT|nr:sigma-E processing peptidase SpoIIGA [Lactonifactor longoviformis]SHE32703.1 Sporulation factor SpoIIGA [Lactonifactor longoviformis DSM 17459]
MYYEIYIDVLFVVNMVMDYFLLRLVNRLLGGSATCLRSLAGSAIGAAGMCLAVLLPFRSIWIILLFMHGFIGILMVRVGCGCKGIKRMVRGVLTLYLAAFLAGGLIQALLETTRLGNWAREILLGESPGAVGIRTFLFLSIVSYWAIIIGIRLYGYLKAKVSEIYDISLYVNGKCERVKGLYDTGNHLQDTVTHKPVSVVEYQAVKKLLSEEQDMQLQNMMQFGESGDAVEKMHPHYVLYHSVGKEQGLLLAVTLDILCVSLDSDSKLIQRPVVALTGDKLSQGNKFQMIINPKIIDN